MVFGDQLLIPGKQMVGRDMHQDLACRGTGPCDVAGQYHVVVPGPIRTHLTALDAGKAGSMDYKVEFLRLQGARHGIGRLEVDLLRFLPDLGVFLIAAGILVGNRRQDTRLIALLLAGASLFPLSLHFWRP